MLAPNFFMQENRTSEIEIAVFNLLKEILDEIISIKNDRSRDFVLVAWLRRELRRR
jgi:hypothetical protein